MKSGNPSKNICVIIPFNTPCIYIYIYIYIYTGTGICIYSIYNPSVLSPNGGCHINVLSSSGEISTERVIQHRYRHSTYSLYTR